MTSAPANTRRRGQTTRTRFITKKRIRVCHVITQLELGGAQDNTLTTVERLPAEHYETHLISGPGGLLDDRARRLGERYRVAPHLARPVCPWRDVAAFLELKRLFRTGRYDIVHTHSSKAGVLGRLAARAAGVPLIFHTAHGWGFHAGQPAPVRSLFVWCERVSSRVTDRIVAVSEATVRNGLAAGVGRPAQYRMIRSGIDPRPYREATDVASIRHKMGFDPARPLITMVACLKPQKSPLDFIDLAARVRSKLPGVQFALAGDGELRVPIEASIERNRLGDTVRLLGWRSDIPDLIRASDLTVLTSRWEGLPRVFLESLAAGVPVIATRVDGGPEAVTDGVNGFLFPPGDTPAMAQRVIELMENPAGRSALREGARSSWKDDFDIRHMVGQIDRLYQERVSGVFTRT